MTRKGKVINMSNKKTKEDKESASTEDAVKQEMDQNAPEVTQDTVKTEPSPEEKITELNDRFLRLYAEFENYRKRTNQEKVQLIGTANASLMKDLLPVLDDFERAISSNEQVQDIQVVKDGFGLISTKFKSILEAKGLKPMLAQGEAFDSELHEAVANIPAPDKKLVGKVVDDVEKGYYLNDKVIRFAKVVVGQ